VTTGLEPRPTATTIDVETLVNYAWEGRIRVPHFQRDYRWTIEDVARLFDSIVRGYPIGSLLLWVRKAPRQVVRLGALEVAGGASTSALWVVDGQQRVTSLANALHPEASQDSRFALAYDLATGRFAPYRDQHDPTVIPLPVIFDLQRIIEWFAEHREIGERLNEAAAVTRIIRQYEVPAYQVADADVSVLQDIFDRMNNHGKRLSRAEIFSALFAGDEAAKDTELTIQKIGERIDASSGFGHIDDDTILRAILARRGPDVAREIRTEFSDSEQRGPSEFPGEGRDAAYEAGAEALRRAVMFLQDVAGVPHLTFLPYRYLLIVLSRFFAHHAQLGSRNEQLLRRWYWRAALVGREPFKGGISAAVRTLCTKIRPGHTSDSVQGLLGAVDRAEWASMPDLSRFRTNEAATKIMLGAYWNLGPRSFSNGEPFDRNELSGLLMDRSTAADVMRHIVTPNILPERYRLWAANRILLPTEDVWLDEIDRLLTQPPINLDVARWRLTLRSHGIVEDAADLLARGKVEGFLEARQETLKQDLRGFLSHACAWGLEDTPPLDEFVIEDLEVSDDVA
jgi:Protein of unknown function DUF262